MMKKSTKEAVLIAKHIHLFLTDYVPNHKTNSDHTIRAYTITLSLYLKFLETEKGITPLTLAANCFNQLTIEEWLKWLSEKRQAKPQTCNNRLSSLRVFLKYLASREITTNNIYVESTTVPLRKTTKTKVTGMSKKAVQVLLSTIKPTTKTGRRDLVLLIMMYNTATRISEILELKIKNVYIGADTPYITIVGKGMKLRSLYLLPKTVAHLEKYINEFHGNDPHPESYLFYSRNKGLRGQLDPESVRKRMRLYAGKANELCKEVPINLHPHQIRHAKSTHWLEDGMNIIQISLLLGHEQLETTMKYLDVTIQQEAEALATLEDDNERKVAKIWKEDINNLEVFCGIRSEK